MLCNGTKAEAQAIKEELGGLLNTMGLTLSEEKTKITHITEGFEFLGYKIIRSMGKNGDMAPKVHIPKKAITRFQHKMREILAPSITEDSVSAKIVAQNALTRGWCQYYQTTSSPSSTFDELSHELWWLMAHWLGRKYETSIPQVVRRFKKENSFGTKNTTLIMPDEYKAKKLLRKKWFNPYTEKEKIVREKLFWYESLWIGNEDREGSSDLREEVIRLKGTTCYVCGTELHPYEVEIDHMKPRVRFKDKTEADRMKHLQPLCTSCHRAKTKTDLKVLSRMR